MHLSGQAVGLQFLNLTAAVSIQNWHDFQFDNFLSLQLVSISAKTSVRLSSAQIPGYVYNGLGIATGVHGEFGKMDPLLTAAAAGIRARLESLDILANNIANASAAGFKADREFYGLYLSSDGLGSSSSSLGLPVIERPWTDFAQGSLVPTSNPLDVALNGQGFFAATSSSGSVFTRDGSFRLSAQGQLQTADGYAVQDSSGNPIQLDSSKAIEIAPDGTVRQDGEDVSRLAVVNFRDPESLVKRGNSYFQTDLASMPAVAAPQTEVQQGKLESANAQPAESAIHLVTILRQFESLQKAMSIGAEMDRSTVQEVAKVSE